MTTTTSRRTTATPNSVIALRMARDLMDDHGLKGWTLEVSNSKRFLGQCDDGKRIIRFSKHHLRYSPLNDVRMTVLHEIAHALVGCAHMHNLIWYRKCIAIGGDGKVKSMAETMEKHAKNYIIVCNHDSAVLGYADRSTYKTEGRLCKKHRAKVTLLPNPDRKR